VAGQLLITGIHRKIAQRQNANHPPIAIQNDKSTDLVLFHHVGCVADVLIFVAVDYVWRHHVAD
jgi:hypothetical protein